MMPIWDVNKKYIYLEGKKKESQFSGNQKQTIDINETIWA